VQLHVELLERYVHDLLMTVKWLVQHLR